MYRHYFPNYIKPNPPCQPFPVRGNSYTDRANEVNKLFTSCLISCLIRLFVLGVCHLLCFYVNSFTENQHEQF